MFPWPGQAGASPEQRVEIMEFLRDMQPLTDSLDQEFQRWMEVAADDSRTLTLERDPDGQHAAVYLWRVSQAATDFVNNESVVPAARSYYEAYALMLEARAAAASLVKEAADLALIKNPSPKIAEANRQLAEAERQLARARAARGRLEARLRAP